LLIVRDKVTRQCPQTTTFEVKGEPKQVQTEVPLITSLTPYRQAKPGCTGQRLGSHQLALACIFRGEGPGTDSYGYR